MSAYRGWVGSTAQRESVPAFEPSSVVSRRPAKASAKRLSISAAVDGHPRVEAVLAVLKGEVTSAEAARHVGVSEDTLNNDRARFIKAGRDALSPLDGRRTARSEPQTCTNMAVHALGAMALERFEVAQRANRSEGL